MLLLGLIELIILLAIIFYILQEYSQKEVPFYV